MTSPSPLILALDIASKEEALQWVEQCQGRVSIFKVGMQLFYHYGPSIVREIQDLGALVFLDLKLHDIPNTVAHACESLLELDVHFLTIHISGGPAMLEAALNTTKGSNIKLLGITALTSLDADTLATIYPNSSSPITPSSWAIQLASIAQQVGLYGIVCSAQENPQIRQQLGPQLQLVNPGIRPSGSAIQDQKRVLTPKDALAAGANYLVMGRPILEAVDPLKVIDDVLQEVNHAAGLPS